MAMTDDDDTIYDADNADDQTTTTSLGPLRWSRGRDRHQAVRRRPAARRLPTATAS